MKTDEYAENLFGSCAYSVIGVGSGSYRAEQRVYSFLTVVIKCGYRR